MNIIDKCEQLIFKNQKLFDIYYQNLISYNEKVNLTAIVEKNDVYTKHFLDSILPIDYIPANSKLVDVGTGAGFPGLPIKIVRNDIELTLVDSLNKRITFLQNLKNKLNLNYSCEHSRAEDFAKNNREYFDVAVARAVAKLNTLLEYLLPLVKVGGYVLAYKATNADSELIEAKNAISVLGGEYIDSLKFKLPNDIGERNIIIIKKVKNTPLIYPRSQNKPKTNPIN